MYLSSEGEREGWLGDNHFWIMDSTLYYSTTGATASSFLPSFLGAFLANQQAPRYLLERLSCFVMVLVIIIIKIIFIFKVKCHVECIKYHNWSSSISQESQDVEEDLDYVNVEHHGS